MAFPERLPLFPLKVVLYPGQPLPLHIFELRYREMVRYCLDYNAPFGIVLSEEGKLEEIGCTARIERLLQEYDDGRKDILTVGESRFRVKQIYEEYSYLTADTDPILEPAEEPDVPLRERAIAQHIRLVELFGQKLRLEMYDAFPYLSYFLAQNAGLDLAEKQQLLEVLGENERIQFLVTHFERVLPELEEAEKTRRKVQSNGHFEQPPGSL